MLTHKGTVTLTTPRLILRRFTEDDAEAMFSNWATDEKVTKYLSWSVHESVDATRELLAKWVADYENPETYHWVIEYGGTIIGSMNLHAIGNKAERCELGYCIGSRWWGLGLVTEAAGEVIRFAFEEAGFYRIAALHDTENIGSGRVMLKNGMKQEGVFREYSMRKDGTRGDIACWAVLRKEWQPHSQTKL